MAGTEGILRFLQNSRNPVPFERGPNWNWRNMKKESSISERNEKDSCRNPFGGVSDWRNGRRNAQPSYQTRYRWYALLCLPTRDVLLYANQSNIEMMGSFMPIRASACMGCACLCLSEVAENLKSTFLKTTAKFGRGLSGSISGSTKLVNVLF